MSLYATVGIGQASDGHKAALAVTHKALDKMGNTPVILAMVFFTQA